MIEAECLYVRYAHARYERNVLALDDGGGQDAYCGEAVFTSRMTDNGVYTK